MNKEEMKKLERKPAQGECMEGYDPNSKGREHAEERAKLNQILGISENPS